MSMIAYRRHDSDTPDLATQFADSHDSMGIPFDVQRSHNVLFTFDTSGCAERYEFPDGSAIVLSSAWNEDAQTTSDFGFSRSEIIALEAKHPRFAGSFEYMPFYAQYDEVDDVMFVRDDETGSERVVHG